jgi:hypothetical protein
MRVVYNPNRPGEVSGATFTQLWMVPVISFGFGWIGVLIGIGAVCGLIPT